MLRFPILPSSGRLTNYIVREIHSPVVETRLLVKRNSRKRLPSPFCIDADRRKGPRTSPALKKQNTGGFWVKTTNGEKRLGEVYRPLVEILVGLFKERRLPHQIKIL